MRRRSASNESRHHIRNRVAIGVEAVHRHSRSPVVGAVRGDDRQKMRTQQRWETARSMAMLSPIEGSCEAARCGAAGCGAAGGGGCGAAGAAVPGPVRPVIFSVEVIAE